MKKTILFFLLLTFFVSLSQAQVASFQLSTHILDITKGQPAAQVKITLSKQDKNSQWHLVDEKHTDENGRIKEFLQYQTGVNHRGIYKLTFHTQPYFKSLDQQSFYPYVDVVFELKDDQHYHVPITLSAYGYSTYRGN